MKLNGQQIILLQSMKQNPFVISQPIQSSSRFFGREDSIKWLTDELKNQATRMLLLSGSRSIGKSSLLLHLSSVLPIDDYQVAYVDLQCCDERPLSYFLSTLALTITDELSSGNIETVDAFQTAVLQPHLQSIPNKRLILLFDHMESLSPNNIFWQVVQSLIYNQPEIVCLFATSQLVADLPEALTSLFKGAVTHELWVLAEASAGSLLQSGAMEIEPEAVEFILELAGNHPLYVQMIGHELWQQVEIGEIERISKDIVTNVLPNFLSSRAATFRYLWTGLSRPEQIYASAIAGLQEEPQFMEEAVLQEAVQAQAVRLRPFRIKWALTDLVQRHILIRNRNGQYRFAIPLFHYWVNQFNPLARVKEELDQSDPIAENMFKLGQQFLAVNEQKRAVQFFQQAIHYSPYHAGAQLFLGTTFLEMGHLDHAVKRLERAYAIDKAEVRETLAQALITNAQTKYAAGNRKAALTACDRLQEIQPTNDEILEQAQDIITAVWNQRGDMALQYGAKDKALLAFKQAGNQEKIAELEENGLEEIQQDLEAQAQTAVKKGDWQAAATVYQNIVEVIPDEEDKAEAQKALARSQEEVELAKIFDEGVASLEKEDFLKARMSFMQVIMKQMNYTRDGKRAMALLDQAAKGRAFTRMLSPTTASAAPQVKLSTSELVISADNIFKINNLEQLGKGAINRVVYSPKGTAIALATNRGIYVYHPQLMQEIHFIETTSPVTALAFSADGMMLASGSWDRTVQMWWAADGQLIGILQGHSRPVRSVAFSSNGRYLASGSDDDQIILWRTETGMKARVMSGHHRSVNALAFSPDNHQLLSGSIDMSVRLWDVHNGEQLLVVDNHDAPIMDVAFSPDGKMIASASQDGLVKTWHVQEGSLRRMFKRQLKEGKMLVDEGARLADGSLTAVNSIGFSPHGDQIATASSDGAVRVWCPQDGEFLFKLSHHNSPVISLAYGADGHRLISVSRHRVQQWDMDTSSLNQTVEGHLSPINSIAISPDGKLLTIANGRQLLLWPIGKPNPTQTFDKHTDIILQVACSPDNHTIATTGQDGAVHLWDVEQNEPVQTLAKHPDLVRTICFSPDGGLLVTGCDDNVIRCWQIADGKMGFQLSGHEEAITAVSLSPDGRYLASASLDGTVRLWRWPDGQLLYTMEGHKAAVHHLAFSPDNKQLASTGDDRTVCVWFTGDGGLIRKLEQSNGASLAFSTDGRLLALGAKDNMVYLWQVSDGKLLRSLPGHTAPVTAVQFTLTGEKIITGSTDGTVLIRGLAGVN